MIYSKNPASSKASPTIEKPKPSTHPQPHREENLEIDAFMRSTQQAPGSSPGTIIFTYYENIEGYDKSHFDPSQTNHSISKEDIENVFSSLESVKYYNYMQMYYEMVWFNWVMLVVCILLPVVSLPIVCCLVNRVRNGFLQKCDARFKEICGILETWNSEKFEAKGWGWGVGARGCWIELKGPRPGGLILEDSMEYGGSEGDRPPSVGINVGNSPQNTAKVSNCIFENNSNSTPGDKVEGLDDMENKAKLRLEQRLL
jgi:hypothetical protein